MSTYYEYQDVKVMIAHKLMSMEGWTVYGYHADNSDSMTDYYDPAHWGGIAEKNGYILCVDVYGEAQPEEIRKYNYDALEYDRNNLEKIAKLEQMTVERGASEAEEASAQAAIKKLKEKMETATNDKYVVVGMIPGHMANPPKMNWHIEKDGIYIAKGNGILKYASIDQYYKYGDKYMEDIQAFKKDKKQWADEWVKDMVWRGYYDSEEKAKEAVKSRIERMEKDLQLLNQFEEFINKIDTTCGGLLGEGDSVIYEKVTVTEYKTELKAVEKASGEIKEGQLFILKSNFNYGCYRGLVYRIHESEYNGRKTYHAYKLNGKLTKECTGRASSNNRWFIGTNDDEKFLKWVAQGAIAWCELQEVKTPYEVEKVVKKTVSARKAEKKDNSTTKGEQAGTQETSVNNYTYQVSEDIDTRDGSRIYLVKVAEKLSKEEFKKVAQYIDSIGGHYSRYKRSFLFREDPTEKLNASVQEPTETTATTTAENKSETVTEPTKETEKESVNYTITEDTHTKTGEKIWIVKPENELSKADFAEVKRKFAIIKGWYSSYAKGFIFKYDPSEQLQLKTG